MNVLLINTSRDEYNLGLAKAANYWRETHGASVSYADSVPTLFPETFDVVWIQPQKPSHLLPRRQRTDRRMLRQLEGALPQKSEITLVCLKNHFDCLSLCTLAGF